MYSFSPHHLTSIVKMQKEKMHHCCFYNKQMEAAAQKGIRPDRDKAQASDVHPWLMKLINTWNDTPQTPAEILDVSSPVVCLPLRCAYLQKWKQNHHLRSFKPLLCIIGGAAGDGEQKTEVRSIKGSVLYGCASCVVGTLWEEGHPVNETYTTKNTDSQWSSDGHFTKSCESHTPAGHTILSLSLSLPLAQSIEPSPVLQGFSM